MTSCAKNPSLSSCGQYPRRRAKSFGMRDALKKAHYKNLESLGFPKLDPKPDDVQRAIFSKCIIDRQR